MKKNTQSVTCRLNRVGGEAVIEGVMMKAGDTCCTACRGEDKKIRLHYKKFVSLKKKNKFFNLPLIRGIIGFIESMLLSFSILGVSAEAFGGEELQKEGKVEKWMKKHLGVGVFDVVMVIGSVLGVVLALTLFMYLPNLLGELTTRLFTLPESREALIIASVEGVAKVLIFILYILLVSLMPDIRRVFQYHGAEHKSIACFESGEELTPENVKQYTRFHPRCGTSFMFVMILLGVIIGFVIHLIFPEFDGIAYTATRLLLLPLVVGIGYEFIMLAGKHNNIVTRILSAPGIWMQNITTREPSLDQIEVAITALKGAMPDEFPSFHVSDYEIIKTKKELEAQAKAAKTSSENTEDKKDDAEGN